MATWARFYNWVLWRHVNVITDGQKSLDAQATGLTFYWEPLDQFTRLYREDWCRLSTDAGPANAYLTPGFLVPAANHLAPNESVWVGSLRNASDRLFVAGFFVPLPRTLLHPMKRVSAFRTRHSFQSGWLMDANLPTDGLTQFFQGLFDQGIGAIRFEELRMDAAMATKLSDLHERCRSHWFADQEYARATLEVGSDSSRAPLAGCSKKRLKNIRRNFRKLAEEVGEVEFRIIEGKDVGVEQVECFLRLESSGWKANSSLRADAAGRDFLHEIVGNAAQLNRVFVCELLCNGEVVASTINFSVGDQGFAFKVGSEERLRKYAPGILVEFAYLEHLNEHPDAMLNVLDSGSSAGSYIEQLWPGRVTMQYGHLSRPGFASGFYGLKHWAKKRFSKPISESRKGS